MRGFKYDSPFTLLGDALFVVIIIGIALAFRSVWLTCILIGFTLLLLATMLRDGRPISLPPFLSVVIFYGGLAAIAWLADSAWVTLAMAAFVVLSLCGLVLKARKERR